MSKHDLTQGGIMQKLLAVAVPIMSTQLLQMSYNLADMFWLGRIPGTADNPFAARDAVAASGTAGMFIWLSMAFLLFGRMGAEIGVSQSMGKGEKASSRKYAGNSIFLAAVLGISYALITITLSRQLIGLFGIPEANVAEDAAAYLRIIGITTPLVFVVAAITGIFNGSGNSRTAFYAHALGFTVNMIIDPLFILTLDMGVVGAAWATVVANSVVFVVMAVVFTKGKNRPFEKFKLFMWPKKEFIRQIYKWSLPISLESLLFTLLSMIITRMVFMAPFGGAEAQSVMRVGSQIESLSWLIGGGFGSAITAFVGQNFGAGKWTRIHRGRRVAMLTMTVWGIIVTFALYFFGENLFAIFLPEPRELVLLGRDYLRILAFCQLSMTLEAVASGVLRGMGKTLPPSIISISANIIRVPLAYFLSLTPLGINGIWVGVTIGGALRGFAMFAWCQLDARRRPKGDVNLSAS